MSVTAKSTRPVQRGRLESPFFRAKFRTPSAPRHFLPRPRLLELLDDLAEYPITAIVAPAGAGKTALAAAWLKHCRRPSAWLAVDPSDRDPVQFWHSAVTALGSVLPGAARTSSQLGGGDELQDVLDRVTQDAESGNGPGLLVIDDLDKIDADERACATLTSFVKHRPASVHLLLLSRRRLPLPMDRLRASGELADIHFEALRFTTEEAAQLLTMLCPDIANEHLSALVTRAGGWAAALQLTALSIRSHRHASRATALAADVVSPDRLIDDYLWEEVLGAERPELIAILLSTAVVGRVNYGLAEALTERPDAGDLLEDAEARGLFVTSLGRGGWFEVHDLVRDMLAARFERRWPAGLHEQHARAAQWFEDVGDGLTALDHWLGAKRPDQALRVLADLAMGLLETGRRATVARTVSQIPPDVVRADDGCAVRYAWCQLMVDPESFHDALRAAESVVTDARSPARPRLELLRAVSASLAGDWQRSGLRAREVLEDVAGRADTDPVDRFGWSLVSHAIAFGERWDDGEPTVDAARAAVTNDLEGRWAFEGTRAVGLALAGQPLDALRVAASVRQVAAAGRFTTLRNELSLADALIARELGDRENARSLLEDLAGRPTYPVPTVQVLAQLELAQLRLSCGHQGDASAELGRAESLCGQLLRLHSERDGAPAAGASGSSLMTSLARIAVDLSLATDDLEAATRWSRRVVDPFWGPTCEAKLHLALGDPRAAADAQTRAEPRCARHIVVSGLVLARALAEEDRDAAADLVATAVDTAARVGMLQSVAAEGSSLFELIELAAWRVPEGWLDRLRRILVPSSTGRNARELIDDLTDRERDVLRLLPSRLTLREIAAELYVSQNTLKFHLRAIYRKLGVASREEAVWSARQIRLLPRG